MASRAGEGLPQAASSGSALASDAEKKEPRSRNLREAEKRIRRAVGERIVIRPPINSLAASRYLWLILLLQLAANVLFCVCDNSASFLRPEEVDLALETRQEEEAEGSSLPLVSWAEENRKIKREDKQLEEDSKSMAAEKTTTETEKLNKEADIVAATTTSDTLVVGNNEEEEDDNNIPQEKGRLHGDGSGKAQESSSSAGLAFERRLDRLEFELRKSVHEWRASLNRKSDPEQKELPADGSKWASLSSRLELMEKFVALSSHKLYETEQRVKQLEKCDCRLSCKWTVELKPGETTSVNNDATTGEKQQQPTTTKDNDNNEHNNRSIVLLKMDGDRWQNKCDVCSCHLGHVRCSHIACPEPKCPDPQHVNGKCCPICYKPCVYKSQTIGHGNKLVVNSNQDSCKECMCIDGRLKCQKVEPERRTEEQVAASRQQRAAIANDGLLGATSALDPREYSDDDDDYLNEENTIDEDEGIGLDYSMFDNELAANSMTQQPAARRLRSLNPPANQPLAPPLVCPQVNCRPDHQFGLQNDCCTYCKSFNFCAHYKHLCHPEADCFDTHLPFSANESSQNAADLPAAGAKQLSISDMFKCQCKAGFEGDGRTCRDIDECSSPALNQCDLQTTNCVNLPGGHQCKCRPGFSSRLAAGSAQQDLSAQQQVSVTTVQLRTATPTSGADEEDADEISQRPSANPISGSSSRQIINSSQQQTSTKVRCVDIDECSDGKLNRCHPQARCTNAAGAYRCRCKRGYLGNGFECHKWFSSKPNVAAYLYRHSPAASSLAGNNSTGSGQEEQGGGRLGLSPKGEIVHRPLDNLSDDDDDDTDTMSSYAASERGAYEDDEELESDQEEPTGSVEPETEAGGSAERRQLAAANKMEAAPLKWQQQPSAEASGQQQQTSTAAEQKKPYETAQQTPPPPSYLPREPEVRLNTRTMFFQPPPLARFRDSATSKKNVTQQTSATMGQATTSTTTTTTTTGTTGTISTVALNEKGKGPMTGDDSRQSVAGNNNDNNNDANSINNNDSNAKQSDRKVDGDDNDHDNGIKSYHPVNPHRSTEEDISTNSDSRRTTPLYTVGGDGSFPLTASTTISNSLNGIPLTTAPAANQRIQTVDGGSIINNNNSPGHKRGTIIAFATTTSDGPGGSGRLTLITSSSASSPTTNRHHHALSVMSSSAASINRLGPAANTLGYSIDGFLLYKQHPASILLTLSSIIFFIILQCNRLNHVVTFYFH